MTLEELSDIYQRSHGHKAGIHAIVRALRDELLRKEKPETHNLSERIGLRVGLTMLDQILGDAGEKVAGGSTREDGLGGVEQAVPALTPATDAAPAVCVWLDDGNQRKRRRNSCGLQGANQSWAGMNWICTGCLKPIKFTEANHG